ncbi:hypothetical protein LCGC14_0155930 [marine sediment metagenome]
MRDPQTWEAVKASNPVADPEAKSKIDRLLNQPEYLLAMATTSLAADLQTMADASLRVTLAFLMLEEVESDFPKAAEITRDIMRELLSASYAVVKSTTLAIHERQSGHKRSLVKMHSAHDSKVERAQAIATDLWRSAEYATMRIGSMTEEVYSRMYEEGFAKVLPEKDRVRDWIKPVAPSFARKGGRPPKPSRL